MNHVTLFACLALCITIYGCDSGNEPAATPPGADTTATASMDDTVRSKLDILMAAFIKEWQIGFDDNTRTAIKNVDLQRNPNSLTNPYTAVVTVAFITTLNPSGSASALYDINLVYSDTNGWQPNNWSATHTEVNTEAGQDSVEKMLLLAGKMIEPSMNIARSKTAK